MQKGDEKKSMKKTRKHTHKIQLMNKMNAPWIAANKIAIRKVGRVVKATVKGGMVLTAWSIKRNINLSLWLKIKRKR